MPSFRAFFTNMSVPMPLHRKLYLVFRNNMIKPSRDRAAAGIPVNRAAERQAGKLPIGEEERRVL